MRLLLAAAMLPLVGLSLTACTTTAPTGPHPSKTVTPESCVLAAPTVANTTIKAGTKVTVTGPADNCQLRFTDKSHTIQVQLATGSGKTETIYASSPAKVSTDGSYKTEITIPSTMPKGKARLFVPANIGYVVTCGTADCPVPTVAVTITR